MTRVKKKKKKRASWPGSSPGRKADVRLPLKGNSTSHGARPVHQIISMIKWIRTSRLSIKKSLSRGRDRAVVDGHLVQGLGSEEQLLRRNAKRFPGGLARDAVVRGSRGGGGYHLVKYELWPLKR